MLAPLFMLALTATRAQPSLPSSSLERLAEALVASVKTAEAPVALSVEANSPALRSALAAITAAKLAKLRMAPVVVEAGPELETRAREQGARALVQVVATLEGQKLAARGDTYGLWVNFWSGTTPSRGAQAALINVSVDVDAEALSFAGAVSPPTASNTSYALKSSVLAKLSGQVAAMAQGDVDGDGRAEVVVLVNEEVMVFNTGDGHVVARYDLSGSPRAAVVTRDSYGAISAAPGRVVAWSGKRARAEVLTFSSGALRAGGVSDVVSLDGLGVKLEPGQNRLSAEVIANGRAQSLAFGPQAVASQSGLSLLVAGDGSAALVRSANLSAASRFSNIGPASTLADLDGDGTLEVVVTTNRTMGDDEVRVLSVTAVDALAARAGLVAETTPLFQTTLLRGRAIAAASGDFDGTAGDEVVLATMASDGSGELLVLHRESP